MKNLVCIFSVLAFVACSKKDPEKRVEITGDFNGAKGEMVYVEELTPTAINLKDSVVLDKNGNFKLNLKVPEMGYYKLKTNDNNFIVLILDTVDELIVKGEIANLAKTYSVSGSENSKLMWDLNQEQLKIYAVQDSLQKEFAKFQNSPQLDSIGKQFEVVFTSYLNGFRDHVKEFVIHNQNKFIALAAIENLDQEKEAALFLAVEKSLSEKYPESVYVKSLTRRVKEMNKLSVGTLAPEITLPDTEGKPFSLSNLKGKIVLIDFWASWCRPCRAENPNVVKMYSKYKSKGFEILGVSLDKDEQAWKQAIKEDKLTWKQISDLAQWNSIVVPLYGIKGIPHTVLLDRDGNILAKGLRGVELEKTLEDLLK